MAILKLHELIDLYRDEIIRRSGATSAPPATGDPMNQSVPAFLDQLIVELRDGPSRIEASNEIVMPGHDELISQMSTVSQVTQPYRGVGRSVVEVALELDVAISADDFFAMDQCVDAAIADAVTQHVSRHKVASDRVNKLRDLTDTAIAAFEVLQTGTVGVIGRTGTLVLRSLMDIRALTEQTT